MVNTIRHIKNELVFSLPDLEIYPERKKYTTTDVRLILQQRNTKY